MENTRRPPNHATPRPRPFRLADTLVLVAGAGLSIGLMRLSHEAWEATPGRVAPTRSSVLLYVQWALAHSFVGLGLAQMVLRLMQPRPPIRRVLGQAGFLASASALMACLLRIVMEPTNLLILRYGMGPSGSSASRWLRLVLTNSPDVVVPVLAATWLTLLGSGRWQPPADWVDALGRWVGRGWFATVPVYFARFLM